MDKPLQGYPAVRLLVCGDCDTHTQFNQLFTESTFRSSRNIGTNKLNISPAGRQVEGLLGTYVRIAEIVRPSVLSPDVGETMAGESGAARSGSRLSPSPTRTRPCRSKRPPTLRRVRPGRYLVEYALLKHVILARCYTVDCRRRQIRRFPIDRSLCFVRTLSRRRGRRTSVAEATRVTRDPCFSLTPGNRNSWRFRWQTRVENRELCVNQGIFSVGLIRPHPGEILGLPL